MKFDYQKIHFGIVTPMANEINSAKMFVDAVLLEVEKFPFKEVSLYTVFDNVCNDGTREALEFHAKQELRLKVVNAPENRSVVDAYMRGYQEALAAGCDWILEIDAGFSHDPRFIPAFLERISNGADVVYGTRFTKGGRITNSPFRRKCISRLGGLASNLLLGTSLGDMTSGFILYSRDALKEVLSNGIQSRGPFFQTEMKYHARNLPYDEVPIIYTGASHNVGKKAMDDAKFHLKRLVKERFFGRKN